MDIVKLLKGVKDLNDYQYLTNELIGKYKNDVIPLNMSIIVTLKNVRTLEVEFFKKHDLCGAAFVIIERMLSLPPSKTWRLLGKELIFLIQYWLDIVRNHLLNHHDKWWIFLKWILIFIKDIAKAKLNDHLLKETAECLLDLATRGRPDTNQRYEILHTFNIVCAESSREIRLVFRDQVDPYLVRLGTILASSGHAATQLAVCEAWQRWQLPRQPAARETAAGRWLPLHLYRRKVRELFLDGWNNFYQDSRDFLNAFNENSELVTSVLCVKLSIGDVVLISGSERRQSYLDINRGNRSITVMVDPKTIGSPLPACEALTVTYDNADSVTLTRDSKELTLTILTSSPPSILPSNMTLSSPTLPKTGEGQGEAVCTSAAIKGRLTTLNNALKHVFGDKYKVSQDLANLSDHSLNKSDANAFGASVTKKSTHSGCMVRPKGPQTWKSPSSVSTTSLAQLYDDLSTLPRYEFDKEPVSVCAQPKLSRVSELSELNERNSLGSASTLKLRPLATGQISFRSYVQENKSQSDGELKNKKSETATKEFHFVPRENNAKSDTEVKNRVRNLSPVIQDEKSTSCLLVATIGSADESVINDTLENITNKDATADNIVDILVQEAFKAKTDEEKENARNEDVDTGKEDTSKGTKVLDFTDALKNCQIDFNTNPQNCTVVSKSTSDESNTEAIINDTPMNYVNVRRKTFQRKQSTRQNERKENLKLDVQAVEDFFSQHVAENKAGELIISPTLAKKINETSSDTSEDFDRYLISNKEFNTNINNYEFPDIEVVDCINDIMDQVCSNSEKSIEYLNTDSGVDIATTIEKSAHSPRKIIERDTKPKRVIKSRKLKGQTEKNSMLSFKVNTKPKSAKQSKSKAKGKLDLESASKMSTIIETTEENNQTISKKSSDNSDELDKPLIKRKRKLYSPKDDEIVTDETYKEIGEVTLKFDAQDIEKTDSVVMPKSTATCYKEIETFRQRNRIRMKKTRLANQMSPKTKKINDVFDQLKDTVDSDVQIKIADKRNSKDAVYNFSSDSDDEYFKKKKIEPAKRVSTTTIDSGNSVVATRRGRKVNKVDYTEKKQSSDDNPEVKPRKKPIKRKAKSKIQKMFENKESLVDERMREAPKEVLNTSFHNEKTVVTDEVLVPAIIPPEIELITEDENKRRKPVKPQGKKEKAKLNIELKDKDDDRTISPLPGLVVETVSKEVKELDESLSTNFVDKCKKMYKDGVDTYEVTLQTNTTHNLLSDFDKTINFVETVDEGINTFTYNNEDIGDNLNNEVFKSIVYTDISDFETSNPTHQPSYIKLRETPKSRSTNTKHAKLNLKTKNENSSDKENIKAKITKRLSIDAIKNREVAIDLTELADVTNKRDQKTISSIEITAHGVSDEEPPSNISSTHGGISREVVDMDDNLKEYYLTLTKGIDNRVESNSKSTGSKESKSPVVCLNRLSTEETMKSRSPVVYLKRMSTEEITQCTEKLSQISDEDIRRWLPSKRSSSVTSEESRKSPMVFVKRLSAHSKSVKANSNRSTRESTPVKQITSKTIRKSVISPIKPFESKNVRPKEKLITEKSNSKRYYLRNSQMPTTSSRASDLSCSTRKEDSRKENKRLILEKEVDKPKRRKLEVDVEVTQSTAHSSSVDDWFRRNEPIQSQAPNIDQSIDVIQNIMERINTTLVETHRNTSKKFICLLVNTQQKLTELETNCHEMYKDTATELLQTMAKAIDDKFTAMDKRSRQMKESFMEELKCRAADCIREDWKQKQTMVTLLQEDIEAARVQLERRAGNTEDS